MFGDAANVLIPKDADVYINFGYTSAAHLPANIGADLDATYWKLCGLLNGDTGSVDARANTETPLRAWGGLLYETIRSDFVQTRTFVALERNWVTDRLENPGSYAGAIVVPDGNIENIGIAFQFVQGAKKVRLISAAYAQVARDGNLTDKEKAASEIPFKATIYPTTDGSKTLWLRQTTENLGS